jgi:hypothetical protein
MDKMSALTVLTLFHTAISLVGIATGFKVLLDMRNGLMSRSWTFIFLTTTVATSVTGFFFPFVRFLPAHGVGIVSLIVLSVTLFALYGRQLAGIWRATYAISALAALYLNVFVLVAQLFRRVPVLHALAPTETEPPFAVAQMVVLAAFVGISIAPVRRFIAAPSPARNAAAA